MFWMWVKFNIGFVDNQLSMLTLIASYNLPVYGGPVCEICMTSFRTCIDLELLSLNYEGKLTVKTK